MAKEPQAGQAEDTAAPGGGVDAGKSHELAVERMEAMADDLVLEDGSMVEDVRDFLLNTIKARPKPWSATSQAEQRDVAAACEYAAKELVRQVIEAVASKGVDSIRVLLTKINAGTDIVITGKVKFVDDDPLERDRAIMALHHAINKHVMLTRATVDDYSSGEEAETDEDEPGLQFEAEGDEDEAED